MPIDEEFYHKLKPVEKHNNHYVWKPGKVGDAVNDANVKADYAKNGSNIEPLGIHGTYVAVDHDDCTGEGTCLSVCPVTVFEWQKNPGKSGQDERLDYTDKSDPARESDCIFCMACVTACPTQAISVEESRVQVHNDVKI